MAIQAVIRKKLGDFQLDVSFSSNARRIGILGASGSGKSMTLKCIAGIETPDEGWICVEDEVFFNSGRKTSAASQPGKKRNVRPQKRRIGYLFQNYALFPAMTAAQNIDAGCKGTRAEKNLRVAQMIQKFQLSGLADRLPGELSGGQQQRVALARIMAYQPQAVLLDEPFSALDVFLKDQLQREMYQMLEDYPGTVILVSHSRDEIYRFSEELIIIEKGKMVIHGRTEDLFENPVYKEAAKLTGCKNFSKIKRLDARTAEICDWGITLHLKKTVPPEASCIGFRAHDFIPVWGSRPENSICMKPAYEAQLPFEHNYYLQPGGNSSAQPVCWFVQRDRMPEMKERGLPDYLVLPEDKIMFLREMFSED